jgi:hypothetical protein
VEGHDYVIFSFSDCMIPFPISVSYTKDWLQGEGNDTLEASIIEAYVYHYNIGN